MRSEDRLDPVSLALAAPDSHVVRRYEAPEGRGIWLYVGLYAERAGTGKSAHDPEVCYPAHGWEILGTGALAISVGAEEFPAKLLELHRGLLKEEVVYWFQPARRWPAHPLVEQLLRVGDALAGRPQYAFVRLSTASARNRGPATRDLAEFARQIAGSVRSAVEASH
jgi:EpsI family protein